MGRVVAGLRALTVGAAARDGGGTTVTDAAVHDGGILPAPLCPAATPMAHATVGTCWNPVTLSSAVSFGTTPVETFFRCGSMGPQTVTDLRFSPDGSRLAALTTAGTIRLFATADWTEIAQLAPPTTRVDAFAFSPLGDALATLSIERHEIALWSADQGALLGRFAGPGWSPSARQALAFSHDGHRLASGGGIIDLRTGASVPLVGGSLMTVDRIAFSQCDARVYVQSESETDNMDWAIQVSLYDAATGQPQTLFDDDQGFGGAVISDDGRLVAVSNGHLPAGTGQYDLSIYRADTGELLDYRPPWSAGHIQAFTPDDISLMVTASGGRLDEWRWSDGQAVTSFPFGQGSRLLGFPRADAVAIDDGLETNTWSLSDGHSLSSFPFAATAASWPADGSAGAAVANDGVLFHVWRQSDGWSLCAPPLPAGTAAPTSLALSADGRVLGIGKDDGGIDLYDSQTEAPRGSIQTMQGPIWALALSGDGQEAAAQPDVTSPVQVWSRDGSLVSTIQPMSSQAESTLLVRPRLALSPDAETIAIDDGNVAVLADVATGRWWATEAGSGTFVVGAPFSPDGAVLAGSMNGSFVTWPVADGAPDRVLIAPPEASLQGTGLAAGTSLALTPDWSLAAAANVDALVVWDPLTGTTRLDVPIPHTSCLNCNSVLALGNGTVAVDQDLGRLSGADFFAPVLYDTTTGTELRRFLPDAGAGPVLLTPDGERAYTIEGPDVIAWCR
jgi:WD40 repeat protein